MLVALLTGIISFPNPYTRANASEIIQQLFSQCGPEDNTQLWYEIVLIQDIMTNIVLHCTICPLYHPVYHLSIVLSSLPFVHFTPLYSIVPSVHYTIQFTICPLYYPLYHLSIVPSVHCTVQFTICPLYYPLYHLSIIPSSLPSLHCTIHCTSVHCTICPLYYPVCYHCPIHLYHCLIHYLVLTIVLDRIYLNNIMIHKLVLKCMQLCGRLH